ncbi:MAG: helix-turn-helix domain-containing protein [Thermomicrobiales bacterium]
MADLSFKQALGKVIVTLRERLSLSQEALAGDANVDRTRMGQIERGEANATIDTLEKIATALDQTIASLIVQAENLHGGKVAPTIDPAYLNCSVPLPPGLTHEQLGIALNRAMAILDQIGINPGSRDIQANIYSGAVSNIVTKSLAEVSDFERNKETAHPDLFNPNRARGDPDWPLEIKASNEPNKGGESHNKGKGWFLIANYKVIGGQTHIVQVEVAQLVEDDWVIHVRKEGSRRTPNAVTNAEATYRLRQNSAYRDPEHVPPTPKPRVRRD